MAEPIDSDTGRFGRPSQSNDRRLSFINPDRPADNDDNSGEYNVLRRSKTKRVILSPLRELVPQSERIQYPPSPVSPLVTPATPRTARGPPATQRSSTPASRRNSTPATQRSSTPTARRRRTPTAGPNMAMHLAAFITASHGHHGSSDAGAPPTPSSDATSPVLSSFGLSAISPSSSVFPAAYRDFQGTPSPATARAARPAVRAPAVAVAAPNVNAHPGATRNLQPDYPPVSAAAPSGMRYESVLENLIRSASSATATMSAHPSLIANAAPAPIPILMPVPQLAHTPSAETSSGTAYRAHIPQPRAAASASGPAATPATGHTRFPDMLTDPHRLAVKAAKEKADALAAKDPDYFGAFAIEQTRHGEYRIAGPETPDSVLLLMHKVVTTIRRNRGPNVSETRLWEACYDYVNLKGKLKTCSILSSLFRPNSVVRAPANPNTFTQFERIHLLAMIDHTRVVNPNVLQQILPNRVRTDSMMHAHRRRQLNPRALYLHGYVQDVKQVRDHLLKVRRRLPLHLVVAATHPTHTVTVHAPMDR